MLQSLGELASDSLDCAYATFSTLAALVTGGFVMAAVIIWERFRGQQISWKTFRWFLFAFIPLSCFSAWRTEHRRVSAEAQKAKQYEASIKSLQDKNADLQHAINNSRLSPAIPWTLYLASASVRPERDFQLTRPADTPPKIDPTPLKSLILDREATKNSRSGYLGYDLDHFCKTKFGASSVGNVGEPSSCLDNGFVHSVDPADVCFWLYGSRHFSREAATLFPFCDSDARLQPPCSKTQRPCGSDQSLCCPQ